MERHRLSGFWGCGPALAQSSEEELVEAEEPPPQVEWAVALQVAVNPLAQVSEHSTATVSTSGESVTDTLTPFVQSSQEDMPIPPDDPDYQTFTPCFESEESEIPPQGEAASSWETFPKRHFWKISRWPLLRWMSRVLLSRSLSCHATSWGFREIAARSPRQIPRVGRSGAHGS